MLSNHFKVSGIYQIIFPNGKSYIGKSIHIKTRLQRHNRDRYKEWEGHIPALYQAMNKYDIICDDNNVKILEVVNDIDKLNERERYWIQYYDTYHNKTKGYNETPGGDGGQCGCDNNNSNLNHEDLKRIIDLLQHQHNYYIYQIAEEYNVSTNTISNINCGKHYVNPSLSYPLRPNTTFKTGHKKTKTGSHHHNAKLTEEELLQIYKILQSDYDISLKNIAEMYNLSSTTISKINNGHIYKHDDYDYPLRDKKFKNQTQRKLTQSQAKEIISLLKDSKLSYTQIGEMFNISKDVIGRINKGEAYYDTTQTYPIRIR